MNETPERLKIDDIPSQPGHIYRYRFAADILEDGWSVVDVASGIGYGAEIIAQSRQVEYLGIDKIPPEREYVRFGRFISGVDLNTFEINASFDAAICFETLEHLDDPHHLANELMNSAPLIIVSVPTRPTKHINPFHLHDFTVDDVIDMFGGFELLYIEDQPEELSHIFVFGNSDA